MTYRHCRNCDSPLGQRNRTGLCRPCFARDPEWQAKRAGTPETKLKRAEAIRRALQRKPEIREKQRARSAEFNRSPEMRERSRQVAMTHNMVAKARASRDQSVFTKVGQSLTRHHLRNVPRDYWPLYIELTQRKRIPAAEALETVLRHAETEIERFRRKLETDTCSPSE